MEGGTLVSLLSSSLPLHPWAVSVEDFDEAPQEGESFEIRDGVLKCGSLEICVENLDRVDLSLPPGERMSPAKALAMLTPHLPVFEWGAFDDHIEQVLAEARHAKRLSRLASLIGVGEGLTPSGDDIIVGALAAARCFAPQCGEELQHALPHPLIDHTTRLAAQLIAAACDGQFVETLIKLTIALTLPIDEERIAKAARGVIAMGHRSGVDTLRGFLAAVSILN